MSKGSGGQLGLVKRIVGPKNEDQMRATTGIATLHSLEAITSEDELDLQETKLPKAVWPI